MVKIKPGPTSLRTDKRNIDDMAGAGGGMVLIQIAQQLSDGNPVKSWLIILAPPITILIKYCWSLLSPEVVFRVKRWRTKNLRKSMVIEVDELLNDPLLSKVVKARLRVERDQACLSNIELLQKRHQDLLNS